LSGFHGVLLLIVARNPAQYFRIVYYVGVMNVLAGVFLLLIDVHAGMPVGGPSAKDLPSLALDSRCSS
jgi:presenilin-like A22 family membrane protease